MKNDETFERPELPDEEVGSHCLTLWTRLWVRLFGYRAFSRADTGHAHIYIIYRRDGRYYHAGFTVRIFEPRPSPDTKEGA